MKSRRRIACPSNVITAIRAGNCHRRNGVLGRVAMEFLRHRCPPLYFRSAPKAGVISRLAACSDGPLSDKDPFPAVSEDDSLFVKAASRWASNACQSYEAARNRIGRDHRETSPPQILASGRAA